MRFPRQDEACEEQLIGGESAPRSYYDPRQFLCSPSDTWPHRGGPADRRETGIAPRNSAGRSDCPAYMIYWALLLSGEHQFVRLQLGWAQSANLG